MGDATCSVDDCPKKTYGRQPYCRSHYQRWRRHGSPTGGAPPRLGPKSEHVWREVGVDITDRSCRLSDCDRQRRSRGYCGMHYMRWVKHGDPSWVPTKPDLASCLGCGISFRKPKPRQVYCTVACSNKHLRGKNLTADGFVKKCRTCWERLPLLHFAPKAWTCKGCEELRAQGRKRCSTCRQVKDRTDFYTRVTRDGHSSQCKRCTLDRCKEYNARPEIKAKTRNRHLKTRFGISAEEYDRRLSDQGGVCDICRRQPTDGRKLAVDHDHACCPGEISCGNCVRALLCHYCNFALGAVGDDIAALSRMIDYLRKHREASHLES